MRLCIADPPYLGRSVRWYGGGRGSGSGRHAADFHPGAAEWDRPERHVALVAQLEADFDGWAIAAAPSSLAIYLAAPAMPAGVRVLVWRRRNAPPNGNRIAATWEPVLVRIPDGRRARGTGPAIADVLDVPAPRRGFAGSKPTAWTLWILDALGYQPEVDEVRDLFPGSGAVAAAAAVLL